MTRQIMGPAVSFWEVDRMQLGSGIHLQGGGVAKRKPAEQAPVRTVGELESWRVGGWSLGGPRQRDNYHTKL